MALLSRQRTAFLVGLATAALLASVASAATFSTVPLRSTSLVEVHGVLAVDGRGHLHVAFVEADLVAYGTNASGAWVWEDIPGAADGESQPSLAVGAGGEPHLVFGRLHSSSVNLCYATKTSAGWLVEELAGIVPGGSSSIALHGGMTPHVAFESLTEGLYYATRAPGAWSIRQLTTAGGMRHSLAVDPTGRPHVVWAEVFGGLDLDPHYWTKDPLPPFSGAITILSEPTPSQMEDTDFALAVNGHGQAFLAWYRWDAHGNDDVWYATNLTGDWMSYPVAAAATDDRYPDLVLTGDGSPRIAFRRGSDSIVYAEPGLSAWVESPVPVGPSSNFSDYDHAAAIDGTGRFRLVSSAVPIGDADLFLSTSDSPVGEAPGTCWVPLQIACGVTARGDTTGHASHHASYSCTTWNESGPEIVYAFTLPPGGDRDLTATLSGLVGDLDVMITSFWGCTVDQCVPGSTAGDVVAYAYDVPPGLYAVVVDGYNGAEGPFELTLLCGEPLFADGFESGTTLVWSYLLP